MCRSPRRAAALPILCSIAMTACGSEEEPRASTMTPEQLHREIEALHQAQPKEQSFRLSPLQAGDWNAAAGQPACSFARQEGVLLLADRNKAVLRIGRNLITLPAAGPVDASGAFYRGGRITVSLGAPRTARPDQHRIAASSAGESWRADGTWSCKGGG